jgi:hypothetical protein
MTTLPFNSPFEFVKNISYAKEKIDDKFFEENKQQYIPFIMNRAFSYYFDTVFFANEMNLCSYLDLKMQYDFYFNAVKKSKRFSKWHKRQHIKELEIISKKYKCSWTKARDIFYILQMYKSDK